MPKTILSNSITSVIQHLHPVPTLKWPNVWPCLIQYRHPGPITIVSNGFYCSESFQWERSNNSRDLGPLHTRSWEPVTITLQPVSLVEKVEPVQLHFTLCLRDQWSTRMQDGCKVYMDSYMASNESCFMVTWTIFQKYIMEIDRLTQN